jgi:hypothetical protein
VICGGQSIERTGAAAAAGDLASTGPQRLGYNPYIVFPSDPAAKRLALYKTKEHRSPSYSVTNSVSPTSKTTPFNLKRGLRCQNRASAR